MFLKILQILQENKNCNFIKKRIQHWCFLVKFGKVFKYTFFYWTPPVAASAHANFIV